MCRRPDRRSGRYCLDRRLGTGFSSLTRLSELRVGELKLDRTFVSRLHIGDGRHETSLWSSPRSSLATRWACGSWPKASSTPTSWACWRSSGVIAARVRRAGFRPRLKPWTSRHFDAAQITSSSASTAVSISSDLSRLAACALDQAQFPEAHDRQSGGRFEVVADGSAPSAESASRSRAIASVDAHVLGKHKGVPTEHDLVERQPIGACRRDRDHGDCFERRVPLASSSQIGASSPAAPAKWQWFPHHAADRDQVAARVLALER